MEALDYSFSTSNCSGKDLNVRHDVILLDINLPKIDALKVVKRIHGDNGTKLVPLYNSHYIHGGNGSREFRHCLSDDCGNSGSKNGNQHSTGSIVTARTVFRTQSVVTVKGANGLRLGSARF
jgi:hypothetical protein